MPMVFDELLGLPHVDWADIEGEPPTPSQPPKHGKKRESRRH
jgi:beta-lactamase class C